MNSAVELLSGMGSFIKMMSLVAHDAFDKTVYVLAHLHIPNTIFKKS